MLFPIKLFGLALALGFTCNVLSLKAAEPILTLAMAKLDSSNYRLQNTKGRATASTTPVITRLDERPPVTFEPMVMDKIILSNTLLLQKPARESVNPLMIRKSSPISRHAGTWARTSLQAGYGDLFFDKAAAAYGRTGTGCEEPSCGYLKLQLRF